MLGLLGKGEPKAKEYAAGADDPCFSDEFVCGQDWNKGRQVREAIPSESNLKERFSKKNGLPPMGKAVVASNLQGGIDLQTILAAGPALIRAEEIRNVEISFLSENQWSRSGLEDLFGPSRKAVFGIVRGSKEA